MEYRTLARCTQRSILLGLLILLLMPGSAQAQDFKVGGHFGFVIPMVTRIDGETITVGDNFVIGFPFGLSLSKWDNVAFDMEFVPLVDNDPVSVDLLVHPGIIFTLPQNFVLGIRAAWEVDSDAVGFTPLIAKAFPLGSSGVSFFAELDIPIRWRTINDDTVGSIAVAAHFGFGF